MASFKEEALAKLFEKVVLKHSNEQCSTSDPLKSNEKVAQTIDNSTNKVVDVEKEDKLKLHNESAQAHDSSNITVDDNTFMSQLFEQGESSKEYEGT